MSPLDAGRRPTPVGLTLFACLIALLCGPLAADPQDGSNDQAAGRRIDRLSEIYRQEIDLLSRELEQIIEEYDRATTAPVPAIPPAPEYLPSLDQFSPKERELEKLKRRAAATCICEAKGPVRDPRL